MFQLKKILFMIAVLLLATSSAFAGGAYITEVGTPLSVGTAGVGGVTNTIGADSVFTNPAGMTGIDSDQAVTGLQVAIPTVRFDSKVATAGGSDGGNSGIVGVIPSTFVVKVLNEDWRIGFGVSAAGGGVSITGKILSAATRRKRRSSEFLLFLRRSPTGLTINSHWESESLSFTPKWIYASPSTKDQNPMDR